MLNDTHKTQHESYRAKATEQTTYDTEQAKVWFSEGRTVLIAHPDGPDSEPITATSEIDDAVGHLFVIRLDMEG